MEDNDKFLKIIDKLIDSISSINNNLGPVKDTLMIIFEKTNKNISVQEDIVREIDIIKDQIIKLNDIITIIKELQISNSDDDSDNKDFAIKKLELDTQLKIAKLTQNNTTFRETSAKKWSFWAVIIPAILGTLGVIIGYFFKAPFDKKNNIVIEGRIK